MGIAPRKKPSPPSEQVAVDIRPVPSPRIIAIRVQSAVIFGCNYVRLGEDQTRGVVVDSIEFITLPNGSPGCSIIWSDEHSNHCCLVPDTNVSEYIVRQ